MNGLNGGTENMSDIDMSKMLNSFIIIDFVTA
jgi:hypothetical protein